VFTGLVDDVGRVEQVASTDAGREFRVRCRYEDIADGESIACDGVCLTVREKGAGWFTVAAAFMTLERTTLGEWTVGRRVNLERALRLGDRLGGHMVQGHVDGVGEVRSAVMHEDALLIDVAVPDEVDVLLVPHGSITLDGVSLTVNALPAPGVVQVSIIEYTRRHTSLGDRKEGDHVNVESDVIAKHVQRLVAPHLASRTA
jgi:riboflavin synthase